MEEALALMNPWWSNTSFNIGIKREKYLKPLLSYLGKKEIIFLTGLRRVGKTTLLKQIIQNLLTKTDPKDILYLTLDFIAFHGKTIHALIEEFRKMHGHSRDKKIYLFLDEITHISFFEQELKNFYDLENVKIYASSSSASLLRSKNNYLVGRSRIFEIHPLDFSEYILFKGISVKKEENYLLDKHFEQYLLYGGLPEYVITGDPETIKTTIEQIIYKDIIAFYNIKDKETVEKLFLLLCERVGKRISYAKIARVLGSSVDSVKRYIGYFEETFLFYTIERYAKSMNERTFSPKKIYIADTGIRTIFVGARDKGALFENLVFLTIKSLFVHYYFEDGKEIDFIIVQAKEKIAIESKYKEIIDKKELAFFENAPFSKKIIVQNYKDLQKLSFLIS